MPAKPSVNKCDEHNSMVNRHIGTAYDNVRIVAEHIEEVITVSEGIEPISLYLGAFTAPPTEGWNNEPLKSGNFYLNTTENTLDYYDADEMIWVSVDEETVVQAAQTAVAARDAAILAQVAAELAETNAESSAAAALLSEQNAALSEANSAASATAAATSETNAATSEANALASENAAKASETAAALSESNAATSETNAANSASAAATSEANAGASESAAANSAVVAAGYAADAEAAFDNFNDQYLGAKATDPTVDNDGNPLQVGATYWNTTTNDLRFWNGATWDVPEQTAIQAANDAVAARDDAQISETNAAASAAAASTSESNAATSEANALASEQAAATSASNASTSETNAAASASSASTSASNAATSETNAATSETNAATSASNAATSEANALASANAAALSESNAATSENNAAFSASDAAGSATSASNSASSAASSASAAQTSASQAATSASNAATSETNAATSASNAATSETNAAQSAADADQSYQDTVAALATVNAELDRQATVEDVVDTRASLGSPLNPVDLEDKAAGYQFTDQDMPVSDWFSKMSVKGWNADYYAWEIGSGAGQTAGSSDNLKLWFRTGSDLTWNTWEEVYTSGNKPTASDVGAYTTAQVDAIETGLQNQINTLDGEVVKTSGDQSISGNKIFTTNVITTTIRRAVGADQGLIMFGGGSTRLGGSGSAAGIQIRPNGLDTGNTDFDYFAVKPTGVLQYEGTENMSLVRASNQHGFFAYADGRTFVTGNGNDMEFRPRGLSNTDRRLILRENGSIVHEHSGGAAYTFQDAVNTGVGSSSYFAWTHDDGVRRGFMGFGSSANDNFTIFNDAANNNLVLKDDGNIRVNATGDGTTEFESPGATKLDLIRNNGDTNVNIRYTSTSGNDVYAGKTNTNFAIGKAPDLSSSVNQWMIIGDPAATFRVPVVLDGGSPSSSHAIRRDWAEDNLFQRNVQSVTSQDWNTLFTTGFSSVNNGTGLNQPNAPTVGNAYTYGSLLAMSHTNTNSGVKTQLYFPHNSPNADTSPRLPFYRSGYTSDYGSWRTLLTFQYADGRYTQISSDIRLKTDIKEVRGALDLVNQFGTYSFIKENAEITQILEEDGKYDGSDEHYRYEVGFIAQEVEKVFPHLVKDDARGYKAIKTGDNTLIGVAYQAIRELNHENDKLKAKNQELEERLAAIEAKLGL